MVNDRENARFGMDSRVPVIKVYDRDDASLALVGRVPVMRVYIIQWTLGYA